MLLFLFGCLFGGVANVDLFGVFDGYDQRFCQDKESWQLGCGWTDGLEWGRDAELQISLSPEEEEEPNFQLLEFIEGGRSTMAVKKWSNVYAKTQARQGVVMLAVEKVDPHDASDSRCTCVDPVLRVQVVNLRNRQIYTLRPQTGIQYAPMVGLSNGS